MFWQHLVHLLDDAALALWEDEEEGGILLLQLPVSSLTFVVILSLTLFGKPAVGSDAMGRRGRRVLSISQLEGGQLALVYSRVIIGPPSHLRCMGTTISAGTMVASSPQQSKLTWSPDGVAPCIDC
jgi:hypothetical protein